MSLPKESKIRLLENFYATDYVFFGKHIREMDSCCPVLVEEYMSIKGALMSVMIEMFNLVSHTPDVIEEHIDSNRLHVMAADSAQVAKNNSQSIVESDKARADIKIEVKESVELDKNINVEDIVKLKIQEKAYKLALDNLLVARMISEAVDYQELNTWSGKIVEDAYKILRDSLVESAISINDSE
ncbi:MAG: hypothetical protein HN374_05895 [Cryomorphaceae bacterium]|jgi:hypothetical protein|nr:hypothetical protein [Cryomorphaceae bacterium]